MRRGTVHVIGAGLAGLAAAVRLGQAGHKVILYEAAGQAGGRCRSYFDETLGCRIDNGNHLLVSGNAAAMAYVAEIGAAATFETKDRAEFAFFDCGNGERWSVRPTEGRVPWWLFLDHRRVAGTGFLDYLDAMRLMRAPAAATIAQTIDTARPIYRRLWAPLATAVLNTHADHASARLMGEIFTDTFGRGGAALHPIFPREGLSESLVDPAIAAIEGHGGEVRFNQRLRIIRLDGERVVGLDFGRGEVILGDDETVVLAVTAPVAQALVPGLTAPDTFSAIVNAHFKVESLPGPAYNFLGLIDGTAEWIFLKPGIVSTTTSAAERLLDREAEELAGAIWADVTRAYKLGPLPLPPWRIVREKRATFAATPVQLQRRPGAVTRWRNLTLAGDWTDTGWPATIEGAIRSGFSAAEAAPAYLKSG
jgi:squalene-associated FAD-dependent desaturase